MDRPRSPPAPPDIPPRLQSPPPPSKQPPSDPPRPASRPDSRLSDSRLLPPPAALPPPRHSTATPHASTEASPPASPPHKRFKHDSPLPPPYPCHVDQRWHYSHGPYPTSFYPYPYHQNMPHRVEEMTVDRSISHRSDGQPQYHFMSHSHPTPPPIATLHHSPALSASSLESNSISPSPPITQPSTPYYSHPVSAPPMNQAPPYPYQPNGSMQRYADEPSAPYGVPPGASNLATRSIRPTMVSTQPYPGQANYIIHTDDASTKLSDRVRRKCYNCRTTDTSTWRRSSLTPGKVLCNKCGLFERTHSRPRPEQFPHKRGPVVTQFKQQAHRNTPPPGQMSPPQPQQLQPGHQQQQQQQRLPPMNAQMLPPHHYSHPSLSPLMAARSADPQQQQQYRQGGVTGIGSLLNGPGEAQSASANGSPRQAPQQPPSQMQQHEQHQHQHQQATTGMKRPGSPLEQPMHQQPTPEAHGSPQIAAGSIPNSPRNERREAPSASAVAAAAHRASN